MAMKQIRKNKQKTLPESSSKRSFPPILIISAVILTIIAYVRSLSCSHIMDDFIYIEASKLENTFSQSLLRSRSVAELSFALNYLISGVNLPVFRITNVILHLITGGLAFYLTYLTMTLPALRQKYPALKDKEMPLYIALFAAGIFILHPIQTATVNYITQRMAVMSCMFTFAGFIFYIKGALNSGNKCALFYALSGVSFVLAIFSKENVVMALPMLPVYDLFFISGFKWREFKNRFVALVVLFVSLVVLIVYKMGAADFLTKILEIIAKPDLPIGAYYWTGQDINWTPIEFILSELRIVSRYIILLFAPLPSLMVFDHASAFPVSKGLFEPITTFLSLLFILSSLLVSLVFIKRAPIISFGILWYFITISLESFIALGLDPYFEHRNYLPAFGLFLVVASLLMYLEKFRIRVKKEAVISIVIVVLFILTFVRNGVWAKDEFLLRDTVEKSPQNPRALSALGNIYLREKRFKEAEEFFIRAHAATPNPFYKADAMVNLASVYRQTGRTKEALSILKKLDDEGFYSEKKRRGFIRFIIGEILYEKGDFASAAQYFEKAYDESPNKEDILIYLGMTGISLGSIEKAEGYFRKAVEMSPEKAAPHVHLGEIYLMRNEIKKAELHYQEALNRRQASPPDMQKRAAFGMARIKLLRGEMQDAKRLFQETILISPSFYPPYIFLGSLLLDDDPVGALNYLQKALALKNDFIPDDPNAKLLYYYLGKAYRQKGDKKSADESFRIFVSLAKGDKRLAKEHKAAAEMLQAQK